MNLGRNILTLTLILVACCLATSCNSTGQNISQFLGTTTSTKSNLGGKPANAAHAAEANQANVKPGELQAANSNKPSQKPAASSPAEASKPTAPKPSTTPAPGNSAPGAPISAANSGTVLASSNTSGYTSQGRSFPSMVGSNLLVRTTAYCHKEKDSLPYGKLNAAGGTLQYTSTIRSAAADWSRFPLGTRFKIHGEPQEYVIDDYGSALVGGNTIDLYKPSFAKMNEWGVRHVPIQIIEWGSFEKSRKILDGRKHVKHADHVRQMLKDIESRYTRGHHPALPRSA